MGNVLAKPSDESSSHHGRFERTCWTIILKARDESVPGAAEAMEQFARDYWAPIYRFIRREGYGRDDAKDLTQAFYSHFLEKRLLDRVTERRGKFRSFLLTCLKHFLADERDRAQALKRGGGVNFLSLDALEAEERDALEPTGGMTADQVYERRWARELLASAQRQLRNYYRARDRGALYEALKDVPLGGKSEASHAEIAGQLGMSETAVKSAAHQMRRRYQELLREEIGRTVSSPEEINEEIRHLLNLLGG